MGWFDFLKRERPRQTDACDLLVLAGRVASCKECAFAFYQKHYRIIDQALELRSWINRVQPKVARAMALTEDSADETAAKLRTLLFQQPLQDTDARLLDNAMVTLLPSLARVLHDTSCPELLREIQWLLSGSLEWPGLSRSSDQTASAETASVQSAQGL